MLKIKQWSCTQVSKWSFERLVALALFCNYCNWFDSVWEKFELHLTSTCLSKILAAEYLRETNISVIIIIIINGYLFFRCLKKVFEEEKNENKKENSRGLTTSQLLQKEDRKVKDQDAKVLGFDLLFVGSNNFIFRYYWLFSKIQFSGI